MSDTPETDALFEKLNESPGEAAFYEMHELAQKLERERDQARQEAQAAWDCRWPKPTFSWQRNLPNI